MSTLKEQLKAKIKSDSISSTSSLSDSSSYRQGAHSLLNLILEMDEALEFYSNPVNTLGINANKKAKEARAKLAAWAKVE